MTLLMPNIHARQISILEKKNNFTFRHLKSVYLVPIISSHRHRVLISALVV